MNSKKDQDLDMANQGYYTVAETAAAINRNTSTVYRMLDSGKLEGVVSCGYKYVSEKSVRTFMKSKPLGKNRGNR